MFKIKYFGYDRYALNFDLGTGDFIDTHSFDKNELPKQRFKSIDDCLKYVSEVLGCGYRKGEWNFEEDLDCKGNDGWVLHIMVERDTMKYATNKMIEGWKKTDNPQLIDLLANVYIEEV